MRENSPVNSIVDAIGSAIQDARVSLNTMLPGIVHKYDADTQRAQVQVAIKRKDLLGNTYQIPVITEVPVTWPRAGNAILHFPLTEGDGVMLMFSARSLDNWRVQGGVVEPAEVVRFHDLSDAVAVPGLYPDNDPVVFDSAEDKAGTCLQTGDLKITFTDSGDIKIGKRGNTQDEPIVLGNVLKTYLENAIHTRIDAALNAILTGPIGIDSIGGTVITHPTVVAALTTQRASLAADKSTYLDTPATDIFSLIMFTDKGD